MNLPTALVLAVLASACAASPRPRPAAPSPPYTPPARPAACEHELPRAPGGFEIWDARTRRRESVAEAALRCIREGYAWTEMDDGGTCSETPMRVIYAASARLLSCDDRDVAGGAATSTPSATVCAVQLRYSFGGETVFLAATARILEALTASYGVGTWMLDEGMPCPRVEGNEFGCVLDGVGIVQIHWRVGDPSAGDTCDAPTATIALRAEGDRGTHSGRVTVTYVTADAVEAFSHIAL